MIEKAKPRLEFAARLLPILIGALSAPIAYNLYVVHDEPDFFRITYLSRAAIIVFQVIPQMLLGALVGSVFTFLKQRRLAWVIAAAAGALAGAGCYLLTVGLGQGFISQ